MEDQKNGYFVECLDSGYILEVGGKRSAHPNLDTIKEIINQQIAKQLEQLYESNIRDISIDIDVSFNITRHAPK